jgi:hypothetical protein
VTYGDPLKNFAFGPGTWGSLPKNRTMIFCNTGDGVCKGAFSISGAHLSYTSNGDIRKGVEFVSRTISALGNSPLKGGPPPPPDAGPRGGGAPKNGGAPKSGGFRKGGGLPKGDGPPKSRAEVGI